MNFFRTFLSTVLTIVMFSSSYAQITNNEEKLSLNSGTIDNQFEYVIRRSNSWQDYKTVKKTWLYAKPSYLMLKSPKNTQLYKVEKYREFTELLFH